MYLYLIYVRIIMFSPSPAVFLNEPSWVRRPLKSISEFENVCSSVFYRVLLFMLPSVMSHRLRFQDIKSTNFIVEQRMVHL